MTAAGPDLVHARYRLLEELGRGSMGVVWRAEDTLLDREVALKELRVGMEVDPAEAMDRFLIEARAAGRLTHPNIVGVHDVFSDGDRVLIAMELVAGQTLDRLVRQSGPLSADTVRAIMAQVAQALAIAHAAGIVHRDLKPDNVFWTADGRAVVADFGLARIGAGRGTVEGTIMGTPGYMAPEQVRGEAVGPQADVFGWGAIAYELATGRPPFGDASTTDPASLVYRIVHEAPPPLNLEDDPALTVLVTRALAKNPSDRPADGSALVASLLFAPSVPIQQPAPAGAAAPMPVMSAAPVPAGGSPPPVVEAPPPAAPSVGIVAPPIPDVAPSGAASVTENRAGAGAGSWLRRRRRVSANGARPPSGALLLIPGVVLMALAFLVAFNGGGTSAPVGTLGPGMLQINGQDPFSVTEVVVDLSEPLRIDGTVPAGAARSLRLEFTALGIPLGSGTSDVIQQDDGQFKSKVDATDAARFFVGGRVTATVIVYGKTDDLGIPEKLQQRFPLSSTQSSLRTVPAAIAIVLVLFLLAYVKSSIYWLIYGERRSFETTNLLIGGASVGATAVLLAWLFGAPEPTSQVLVVCVLLGVSSGVAIAAAAYRFAQRRDASQRAGSAS